MPFLCVFAFGLTLVEDFDLILQVLHADAVCVVVLLMWIAAAPLGALSNTVGFFRIKKSISKTLM